MPHPNPSPWGGAKKGIVNIIKMKYKIETCHSELHQLWFQTVDFVADAIGSNISVHDVMVLGKIKDIENRMFKKLLNSKFLASSEKIKLSFSYEDLCAIKIKIGSSMSLLDYYSLQIMSNTVMLLDQKVKSM